MPVPRQPVFFNLDGSQVTGGGGIRPSMMPKTEQPAFEAFRNLLQDAACSFARYPYKSDFVSMRDLLLLVADEAGLKGAKVHVIESVDFLRPQFRLVVVADSLFAELEASVCFERAILRINNIREKPQTFEGMGVLLDRLVDEIQKAGQQR